MRGTGRAASSRANCAHITSSARSRAYLIRTLGLVLTTALRPLVYRDMTSKAGNASKSSSDFGSHRSDMRVLTTDKLAIQCLNSVNKIMVDLTLMLCILPSETSDGLDVVATKTKLLEFQHFIQYTIRI